MSMKLIKTLITHPDRTPVVTVKIYHDTEWEEFVIKVAINGKVYEPATCHEDTKLAALGTADAMFRESQINNPANSI